MGDGACPDHSVHTADNSTGVRVSPTTTVFF